MRTYAVRYVHRIAPSDADTAPNVALPDNAFSDSKALGAALRKAGLLRRGQRLSGMRAEGSKLIAFPCASVWHAIILTEEQLSR